MEYNEFCIYKASCLIALIASGFVNFFPFILRHTVFDKALLSLPKGSGRTEKSLPIEMNLPTQIYLKSFIFVLLWLCLASAPAVADEFRPAYLQLTQVDANTYDVLWKLPALDEATTLKLRPQFPAKAHTLTPISSGYAAGTASQR
jgi:hypothetical protein